MTSTLLLCISQHPVVDFYGVSLCLHLAELVKQNSCLVFSMQKGANVCFFRLFKKSYLRSRQFDFFNVNYSNDCSKFLVLFFAAAVISTFVALVNLVLSLADRGEVRGNSTVICSTGLNEPSEWCTHQVFW